MEQVKLYDTTLRDGMGSQVMSLSIGEQLKLVQTLDRIKVQLGFMNHELEPWHAQQALVGAIEFIERRREKIELAKLARTPDALE